MTTAADQFLTGSGVTSAKFETINDFVVGTVSEPPEVRNQTKIRTGELLTWKDGNPMKQLVVTLQTQLRDGPDDDGLRRIYVKGKSLTGAVRDAVRKAGAKGLEVGGQLKVAYVGDGPIPGPGLNAPKLYLAEYTRPTSQAASDFLGTAQPQAAPPWGQPAQAPAAAQASPWGNAQPPF